jgi:hypothetical protein
LRYRIHRISASSPEIVAEFQKKWFSLLWRGSQDGFEFHRRCDGYTNSLTVIVPTERSIFGGSTLMEREPPTSNRNKADDSMKNFLFTLTDPHNLPTMQFALSAKRKPSAIRFFHNLG